MLKIVRVATSGAVIFSLSGHIDMEHAAQLRDAFGAETLAIAVDMQEVRRVDRDVVAILARWESQGIKLKNCPAYLRNWISSAAIKS